MPIKDADSYEWNVLDITKVWPHKDYPLVKVGRLVLNKNPVNYHAEVEQSAFSPSHLIPGIEPTNDKMLQGRLFSYPDTQRHRLGGNYNQIPINCPYRSRVYNNQRDGFFQMKGETFGLINYEPDSNSTYKEDKESSLKTYNISGIVGRHQYVHSNCDFRQAGDLFAKIMSDNERESLINNLSDSMVGVKKEILERQCKIFYKCHPEYGIRLAKKLNLELDIFNKF